MKHTARIVLSLPLVFAVVLLVAALPETLAVRRGRLLLDFESPSRRIVEYLAAVPSGSVFAYQAGQMTRGFLSDLPDYFGTSIVYSSVATSVGLLLGTASGFYAAVSRRRRAFDVLSFLGNIPDFLFIVLAQLAVIAVTQLTGVRLARVGSAGMSRQAGLLPITALSLYPTVAFMRTVRDRVDQIRNREYLQGAVARGLSQVTVLRRHVFAAVYPILSVEIIRVHALTVGGLFIAERLFNLAGITRWLFNYAFLLPSATQLGEYQYAHVVNCLTALVVLYLVGLVLLSALLALTRRVLVRE